MAHCTLPKKPTEYARCKMEIPKGSRVLREVKYPNGHSYIEYRRKAFVPQCSRTDCIGRTRKIYDTGEAAIEAWNRRRTMKTADEINKGLKWCVNGSTCTGCPYENDCYINMTNIPMIKDAFAYTRRLEANWQQVSKTLCGKENATLDEVLQAVSQVKAELTAAKQERDAAVRDIKFCAIYSDSTCEVCKNGKTGRCQRVCLVQKEFEWRGVCPENTEVKDDD